MSSEPPLGRAQRRREITWFLAAVAGLAGLLLGAPFWAGLLDHIEPLTATAAIVAVSGTLLASRSRHGLGWNAARLLCIAAIILTIAMASLVAVCIPSGCFN